MNELVGYWTDGALHHGHSYWAYAFKADGTGFCEFVNFILVNYEPIRWSLNGDRIEITSEIQYSMEDGVKRTFVSEPFSNRIVCPFHLGKQIVNDMEMPVLVLDLEKGEASDFVKRYQPNEYGLLKHIKVDADYLPTKS